MANVLAQIKYRGVATTCGFVGGMDLPDSVLPFILRNVTLAGIDSVMAPQEVRERAWQRLSVDLDLDRLALTVKEVGLGDVLTVAGEMRAGQSKGRAIVDVNR